jgi:hypothetical protein
MCFRSLQRGIVLNLLSHRRDAKVAGGTLNGPQNGLRTRGLAHQADEASVELKKTDWKMDQQAERRGIAAIVANRLKTSQPALA